MLPAFHCPGASSDVVGDAIDDADVDDGRHEDEQADEETSVHSTSRMCRGHRSCR